MGESSQREILVLPFSLPCFSLSSQQFWQLTISWQIWFGRDDNELLRRSSSGFDAGGKLAAPRIENIEFQQTGNKPYRPLFYYRKVRFG